ncbi:hypothetical protein F52700_10581 [Fusarium sp. NRRL 52700]|nr:hypothetical protein F52700_10581 [Fusarium sp. NRRL 52700]
MSPDFQGMSKTSLAASKSANTKATPCISETHLHWCELSPSVPRTLKDVTCVYLFSHRVPDAWCSIDLIDVPICDILDEPDGFKGFVRMLYQTAMKESALIRHLSFTPVLFAGIIVGSTGLEFMASQNFCPWLQLTQPLEGGEGSDIEMSFTNSEASSEVFTAQHFMASLFDMDFESGLSTPTSLFPTHDTSSQTLSFSEALHLTQTVDNGKQTADNLYAETQPQYSSLDMLSNQSFPLRQGSIDKTEAITLLDASATYRYLGKDSPDRLLSHKGIRSSSALLLTYGIGDHLEPLQSVEEDLPSSREQSIPGPTETCIGDEDGSPCPSMIESDDSSVEDIEVRKAFACPYFRLDPVRHIECLSRRLYRIQDVKQHLSRRHYIKRDTSDNTRGVNLRTQKVLKLRLDRRLSPEGQWHEIWRNLFNGTVPSEGPYLGNSKEEIVGSMISICKQGSSRVVPGILRSLGFSTEKRKAIQQLMEQLFAGFQALSGDGSIDMETDKASACGGVDSIPMTPKDMEFGFDLNIPLHQSPSPEIQNSYSSKYMTEIQESNSVMPTGLPDSTTFEGNGEDDILMRYQSEKQLNADVQVKPACPLDATLGTPHTVESSETACATINTEPAGKSLTCLTHVLEDRKDPDLYEYVNAWECDYCGFEYIFRPSGARSDMLCFNYPCLGRLPGFYYDSVYKARVIRGG